MTFSTEQLDFDVKGVDATEAMVRQLLCHLPLIGTYRLKVGVGQHTTPPTLSEQLN